MQRLRLGSSRSSSLLPVVSARTLSSAPPSEPPSQLTMEDVAAHEQRVRKRIEQRDEFLHGRHRRRPFVAVENPEQLRRSIGQFERMCQKNGLYKYKFKSDTRHTNRHMRRLEEEGAKKWRAFKRRLNESLAVLLEHGR